LVVFPVPAPQDVKPRVSFACSGEEQRMSDSQRAKSRAHPRGVDEDDVKAREREKLDIGDSHPEERDIAPEPARQGDGLDVGDPHPENRDTESKE
jgi:hypothetical protein